MSANRPEVTKTFTVTTSPELMARLERFLALLHFNSNFGHSGMFAMPLDGDGSEKIRVAELVGNAKLARQVDLIGGVGYDIEVARSVGYSGRFIDRERDNRWSVYGNDETATLMKNGEVVKEVPNVL